MIAAKHSMMGGDGIFKSWYPRWGTEDAQIIFNGIYNAGVENPHDNSARGWVNLVNGRSTEAKRYTPIWSSNSLDFDSIIRTQLYLVDFSLFEEYTLEVFGYFPDSWGVAVGLYYTTDVSSKEIVSEVMPYAANTGAYISIDPDAQNYTHPYSPSTNDLCVTCTGNGEIHFYNDGVEVKAMENLDSMGLVRRASKLSIGGDSNYVYHPNGSRLYGIAVYKSVLTPKEVMSLYKANVKNYGVTV